MNRLLSAVVLALFPASALFAGPADYVFMPAVTYGEREIDFKSGTARNSGDPRMSAASIGFGYGATQRWFTEIYRKYESSGDEGMHFDAWEWENKFQLTEAGEYPVDAGFIVEIEHPKDRSEGNELRLGPLLQTELGKLQLNANILFERHYRAESPQRTELGYQWQVKYRLQPKFEYGFQGFGELGQWNRWDPPDQQTNRMGPAVFGKVGLGNRQALRYNAAWLFGVSKAAPDHTFRFQAEYEF